MNTQRALTFGALCLAAALISQPSAAQPPPAAPSTSAAASLADIGGSYVLTNATVHVGDGVELQDAFVHVEDGVIKSVGTKAPNTNAKQFDLGGSIVTPGIIAADTSLGLIEIDLEASTRDNSREDDKPIRAGYDPAPAIHADSSLIQVQAVEGITTAAVAPGGPTLSGQVAWIDLLQGDYKTIVARRGVAIDGNLGQAHAGSRAATLALLEEALTDAKTYKRSKAAFNRGQSRTLAAHPLDLEALIPVVDGKIPLTITAHRAGDITALVDLATRLKLKLVIVGGTEAWKVADILAEAKVPVVIQPSNNLPSGFDKLGATLENAARLHKAGVPLVIARPGDGHNVRNVTQEAGIAVAYGLPADAALTAITLGVARAYGMDDQYGSIEAGKVANLVIWEDDPLELSSFPRQVVIRGNAIDMKSRQTLLRERYQDLSEFQ